MPRLVDMYMAGKLKLDDMISRRIKLDQVNEAFVEMKTGAVARSVIVFTSASACSESMARTTSRSALTMGPDAPLNRATTNHLFPPSSLSSWRNQASARGTWPRPRDRTSRTIPTTV